MRASAPLLALALIVSACNKAPGAYKAAGDAAATADGQNPTVVEANALWEQRDDPVKLKAALDKYEAALADNPQSRHVLRRLTRGWYFYGDAHASEKEAKMERWVKAIDYGKKCLAVNPEFRARIEGGEKEKDAIGSAVKADVPCIYWLATSIGKWGNEQSLTTRLKNLPTVKAYMSAIDNIDATFFHYGPSRYWAAYYALHPLQKDLVKSGEFFAASAEGSPYYLPTRGLRAEYWAVRSQDVGQFTEDLEFILAFDVSTAPDVRAENLAEQAKAKTLLADRARLFDKKAIEAYLASQ